MTDPQTRQYIGRGGIKLDHALRTFALDPANLRCADFGCNIGGFTDCLLQHHAAHVYALDTGYGMLDYRLRNDPRVTVMERTNALHAPPPSRPVDLVVADMAWTRQARVIPAALAWIGHRPNGRIISLIKPQYESRDATAPSSSTTGKRPRTGILPDDEARAVCQSVVDSLPDLGIRILALTDSPIRGGASKGHAGNIEFLLLATPSTP